MKRSKKLWIMAAVLAAVLVLTLSVAMIDHKMEQIQASDELILEIPVDTVTALSWEDGDKTLSFQKDDSWHYDGDPDFPVSRKALEDMLRPFEAFRAAFVIEDVEDFGQYGLEKPENVIRFTASEEEYTLSLGAFSAVDSQRYVTLGGDTVYLMYHDPMEEFDAGLYDVIDNDYIPYLSQADALTFTGKEDYSVAYEPENGSSYREEDKYFANLRGQLLPLDTTLVQDYLDDLTMLSLKDYVTYRASQEDLAEYGMDEPNLTVQVDYTLEHEDAEDEKRSFTVHLSQNPEQRAAADQAADQGEEEIPTVTSYARMDGSELIYEIPESTFDRLTDCGYNDLRHREILPADFADADEIRVTLEGKTYTITTKLEDEKKVYFYGDREIDIVDIATAAQAVEAAEFADSAQTGKQEIRLELLLPEDRSITLELYRLDGSSCFAKVDGKPVGTVPRQQVVDLQEAVNTIVLEEQDGEI